MENHVLRWKRALVALTFPALFVPGLAGAAATHQPKSHGAPAVAAPAPTTDDADAYQNGGVDGV
jgi:hypothetical protein